MFPFFSLDVGNYAFGQKNEKNSSKFLYSILLWNEELFPFFSLDVGNYAFGKNNEKSASKLNCKDIIELKNKIRGVTKATPRINEKDIYNEKNCNSRELENEYDAL